MRIAICVVLALSTVSRAEQWKNPIVKKGYLHSPLGEITPFVLNGKLYRLDSWQKYWELPGFPPPNTQSEKDTVRVWDVEADKLVSNVFENHGFATGFVWEGRIYVFSAAWDRPNRKASKIDMTSSDDAIHWTPPITVWRGEGDENLYNVAVCRGKDSFILLYETDDSKYIPFTFKYCSSPDLKTWKRIPDAYYGRDKYVGGPALYYEGDTYYTLYLESLGDGKYDTRITRSKDLIHWQDAAADRPFITFDPTHKGMMLRPPELPEKNASDVELCEWKGKTFIYFTGSDQTYAGDLQWAEYDGKPRELFEHFFK